MIRLLEAAAMRELDRATIEDYGLPSTVLMEHAGRAVAEAIAELPERRSRHVTVLCGRGNNGGDGFVAARWMLRLGLVPEVFLFGAIDNLAGDAKLNAELYCKLGQTVETVTGEADLVLLQGSLRRAGGCVDALLGTGASGAPREPMAAAIRLLNACGAAVVAADIPSGVDADTGACAEPFVRATVTVTFGAAKRGLAVHPGAGAAGRLQIADIGLPPHLLDAHSDAAGLLELADIAALLSPRPAAAHKGDAGRVLIVGGSLGLGGAVALAGRAAARGGAGLVTVAVPDCLADAMEAANLEVMSYPLRDTRDGHVAPGAAAGLVDLLKRSDVVAVGPGLGRSEAAAELLGDILGRVSRPIVLDADALNLLAERPGLLELRRGPLLLTPHPGEAARLTELPISVLESDRYASAAGLARRFNATVILKGARSMVAAPDGRLAVNPTGCPAMASGGMGDALTGLLAALLAQGLGTFESACAAAWLHGRAGEIAAAGADAGLLASDLIEALPAARRELREPPAPARR